jgi:uncharacterized protein
MRIIFGVFVLLVFSAPVSAQYQYRSYPGQGQYAAPPQYTAPVRPSFDCAQASKTIERAICADPGLSALDAQVGQLYKKILSMASNADEVTAGQRSWIASRNSSCEKAPGDKFYECIEKSEQGRASTLSDAIKSAQQEIVEKQAAAQRDRIAQEDSGYDRIQIDDFVLDSKSLISSEKKIVIPGFYKRIGGIEELYPSAQAALLSSDKAGMIYILSENADRDLRAYFLRCARNEYAACPIRVRGYASTCDLTLGSLSASKPCLIVEGGATP